MSSSLTGHCSINHGLSEGVYRIFMGLGGELFTLAMGLWGKNEHMVVELCLLKCLCNYSFHHD